MDIASYEICDHVNERECGNELSVLPTDSPHTAILTT